MHKIPFVHVTSVAVFVAALTLHCVVLPLPLIRVTVRGSVLAHPMVLSLFPLSLVDISACEDVLALADAPVVLPFANVRRTIVVLDLAMTVAHAAARQTPSRCALQPPTGGAYHALDISSRRVCRVARVREVAEPRPNSLFACQAGSEKLDALAPLVGTAQHARLVDLDLALEFTSLILPHVNLSCARLRILAKAVTLAVHPPTLVDVAGGAVVVAPLARHLVVLPLALVLIAVGARVFSVTVVQACLPLAFVDISAREGVLARADALVMLP
mmetsp:Transcript_85596/g.170902  ORF Transcript_85596/g.170902 Transcript_85596/m.170902 type:complete len:272 (+) Transcript_85596:771-1586(+)